MSGRNKLILGNWKMHFTVKQSVSFASKLAKRTIPKGVFVGIAPQALALSEVSQTIKNSEIAVIKSSFQQGQESIC